MTALTPTLAVLAGVDLAALLDACPVPTGERPAGGQPGAAALGAQGEPSSPNQAVTGYRFGRMLQAELLADQKTEAWAPGALPFVPLPATPPELAVSTGIATCAAEKVVASAGQRLLIAALPVVAGPGPTDSWPGAPPEVTAALPELVTPDEAGARAEAPATDPAVPAAEPVAATKPGPPTLAVTAEDLPVRREAMARTPANLTEPGAEEDAAAPPAPPEAPDAPLPQQARAPEAVPPLAALAAAATPPEKPDAAETPGPVRTPATAELDAAAATPSAPADRPGRTSPETCACPQPASPITPQPGTSEPAAREPEPVFSLRVLERPAAAEPSERPVETPALERLMPRTVRKAAAVESPAPSVPPRPASPSLVQSEVAADEDMQADESQEPAGNDQPLRQRPAAAGERRTEWSVPREALRREQTVERPGPVSEVRPARASDDLPAAAPLRSAQAAETKPGAAGPLSREPRAPQAAEPQARTSESRSREAPRDVLLRLADANSQPVSVRLRERAGVLQVTVRAHQEGLVAGLRQGLPELVSRLEQRGFETEVWRPGATAAAGRAEEHPAATPAQAGARGWPDGGNSDWAHGQGHGRREQQPDRRWLEEVENSTAESGASTHERID